MALDLGVDVLALCAQRQQLHQVDMVLKGTAVICAVALRPHQLHKSVERTAVIVEQQNFLSCAHQLHGKRKKTKIIMVSGCVNSALSPIPPTPVLLRHGLLAYIFSSSNLLLVLLQKVRNECLSCHQAMEHAMYTSCLTARLPSQSCFSLQKAKIFFSLIHILNVVFVGFQGISILGID